MGLFLDHMQVTELPNTRASLSEMANSLCTAAQEAGAQVQALCDQHGFDPGGLDSAYQPPPKRPARSTSKATPGTAPASPAVALVTPVPVAALPAALCLAAHQLYGNGEGLAAPAVAARQRAFAAAVLRRFTAKVAGLPTDAGEASAAGGGGVLPPVALTESEQVRRLIVQATSVDNLARMFEGWMPWV